MMGTHSNNCKKQQQKVQKQSFCSAESSTNITAVSVFIVSWCHNSAAPLLAWFWAKSSVTFKLRNLRWAKLICFKATATVRYRWASAKVITHPVMTLLGLMLRFCSLQSSQNIHYLQEGWRPVRLSTNDWAVERPGVGTEFRWKTDENKFGPSAELYCSEMKSVKSFFFALLCSLCTHNAKTAVLHEATAKTERKVTDNLFTFTAELIGIYQINKHCYILYTVSSSLQKRTFVL